MTKIGEFNPLSVRILCKYLYNVSFSSLSKKQKNSLVMYYAHTGNTERMRFIMKDRTIRFSMLRNHPLHISIIHLNIDMIQLLLSDKNICSSVKGHIYKDLLHRQGKYDVSLVNKILLLLLETLDIDLQDHIKSIDLFVYKHRCDRVIDALSRRTGVDVNDIDKRLRDNFSFTY